MNRTGNDCRNTIRNRNAIATRQGLIMKLSSRLAPTRAQLFTATLITSAMGLSVAAVSLPNTFTAGTSASAAQVNANFAALKAAVDALQTQAAADTAKIAALEGKLAPLGSNPALPSKRGLLAYAFASDATSTAVYTPNSIYSYSSTGGAITAQKQGAGLYLVTFAGMGANASAGGNVQVSSVSNDATCNVNAWVQGATVNDVAIQVQCKQNGTAVDSTFSVMFVS